MAVVRTIQGVEVRFVKKSESPLMRAIGWVLKPFVPRFMTNFFTTIGRTIYHPDQVNPFDPRLADVIEHEVGHIKQADRFSTVGHSLLYLLFPVPIFFAWYRWWAERGLYLKQIRVGRFTTEKVVDILWSKYFWPWPKGWMRKWFERELGR